MQATTHTDYNHIVLHTTICNASATLCVSMQMPVKINMCSMHETHTNKHMLNMMKSEIILFLSTHTDFFFVQSYFSCM